MARQLYQLNTKLKVKPEKGVGVGLLTGLLQKISFIQMHGYEQQQHSITSKRPRVQQQFKDQAIKRLSVPDSEG